MKTNRLASVAALLFITACLVLPLASLAQVTNLPIVTNTPVITNAPPVIGDTGAGGVPWTNVAYLIPLAAPAILALFKKLMNFLNVNVKGEILPYACIGIALILSIGWDLAGKLHVSPWLYGPIAGALGIGMREVLTKGTSLLGIGGGDPSPAPTPPSV